MEKNRKNRNFIALLLLAGTAVSGFFGIRFLHTPIPTDPVNTINSDNNRDAPSAKTSEISVDVTPLSSTSPNDTEIKEEAQEKSTEIKQDAIPPGASLEIFVTAEQLRFLEIEEKKISYDKEIYFVDITPFSTVRINVDDIFNPAEVIRDLKETTGELQQKIQGLGLYLEVIQPPLLPNSITMEIITGGQHNKIAMELLQRLTSEAYFFSLSKRTLLKATRELLVPDEELIAEYKASVDREFAKNRTDYEQGEITAEQFTKIQDSYNEKIDNLSAVIRSRQNRNLALVNQRIENLLDTTTKKIPRTLSDIKAQPLTQTQVDKQYAVDLRNLAKGIEIIPVPTTQISGAEAKADMHTTTKER